MRNCRSDLELARQAAAGDDGSWEQIFATSGDRLFSFLCYQVENRDEALDLLQETFLQAFRCIDRYRGDAPLEAWLRAIALRKALDWKRRVLRKLKRLARLDDTMPAAPTSEREIYFESECAVLRDALAGLSSHQRGAFLLREWEERSFREIAGILRCKESTARVHYTRALRKLRRILSSNAGRIRSESLEGQPT